MYKGRRICVVVPAHNEERLIGQVIDTMPAFVDRIVIVDDHSPDRTVEVARSRSGDLGDRLVVLEHARNRGVGGAIATGYKWARDHEMDATAVMAGDAQMDPADLPALLDPVIEEGVDYTKGNRLTHGEAWRVMPKRRYLGNAGLSLLTKIASGYWHVADSQSGYTVISLRALRLIDPDAIYRRYGMPNHFLVMLNINSCRVRDIPIRPVYRIGEKSGFEPLLMIPKLGFLLAKWFLWRLKEKYIIRDFHPLVLFYFFGLITGVVSLGLFVRMLVLWATLGHAPPMTALAFGFFGVVSVQLSMFAMWFDMEANKDLKR